MSRNRDCPTRCKTPQPVDRVAPRGARREGHPGKVDHRLLEPRRRGRRDWSAARRRSVCAPSSGRFSPAACRNRWKTPSRCRSADSTRRCWWPTAPCQLRTLARSTGSIVHEFDRYHGVYTAARNVEATVEEPLALLAGRSQTAPQTVEKPRSAPGNDGIPTATDEALACLAGLAQARIAPEAPPIERPETAPQAPEKAQFAPGNGTTPDTSNEPFVSPLAA